MKTKLSAEQRATELEPLLASGWSHDGACDGLRKCFEFADFVAAFAWMTQVADIAERLNHHPEWRNIYNRVEVCLTTHDAGGLTELDIRMAQAMDDLL